MTTETKCPRCKRIAVGWSMKRSDTCSPHWWAECIREPETIKRKHDMISAMLYDAYNRSN